MHPVDRVVALQSGAPAAWAPLAVNHRVSGHGVVYRPGGVRPKAGVAAPGATRGAHRGVKVIEYGAG